MKHHKHIDFLEKENGFPKYLTFMNLGLEVLRSISKTFVSLWRNTWYGHLWERKICFVLQFQRIQSMVTQPHS